MVALKSVFFAATLVLASAALAADPAPPVAMARALLASTPNVAALDLEGGVSQVTVTAAGAIGVLD